MAERIKIGLTFSYKEDWIGGTYYFLNLVRALNKLEDNEKPHLTIISKKEADFNLIRPINYPYIDYAILKIQKHSSFNRAINKLGRIVIGEKLIKAKAFNKQVDILFRGSDTDYFRHIPRHLFWIPDFQEDYLPDFFKEREVIIRKKHQSFLASNSKDIVFSSQDALNDFNRLYPNAKGRTYVMNFAVSHPEYNNLPIKELLIKHNLKRPYFFCPNQFWKHKNHQIVFEALNKLKNSNKLNFIVAFSGKEFDHRNPNHFENLKKFVDENNLSDNVRFLGFIDRKEQLQLMNHAKGIIQPSLFEGWSTVIEDAKAMNQNIIASNLAVHKEQLGEKGFYFKKNDSDQLAEKLNYFQEQTIERPNFNYENRIEEFGKNFMQIARSLYFT